MQTQISVRFLEFNSNTIRATPSQMVSLWAWQSHHSLLLQCALSSVVLARVGASKATTRFTLSPRRSEHLAYDVVAHDVGTSCECSIRLPARLVCRWHLISAPFCSW